MLQFTLIDPKFPRVFSREHFTHAALCTYCSTLIDDGDMFVLLVKETLDERTAEFYGTSRIACLSCGCQTEELEDQVALVKQYGDPANLPCCYELAGLNPDEFFEAHRVLQKIKPIKLKLEEDQDQDS